MTIEPAGRARRAAVVRTGSEEPVNRLDGRRLLARSPAIRWRVRLLLRRYEVRTHVGLVRKVKGLA